VPGENISTLVQKASDLIREIQMNFLQKNQVPDLCVSALRPFTSASHEYVRHYVTDKMFLANKLIMNPSSATSTTSTSSSLTALDPLVLLQGLEELYLTLKQQSNYPPGEQIASDQKFKAMQGEVKKLKEELGKLTQDRSASSTKGSKNNGGSAGPVLNKKGEPVVCFKCKGNHYQANCPIGGDDANSNSNGSDDTGSQTPGSGDQSNGSQGGNGNDSGKQPKSNGLTSEEMTKTQAAIATKKETMPPRENVPDDAKHHVTVDGKVTAKYCRHCGRFVKGKNAHYTSDCRLPDSRKFAYVPRAGGNMASASPLSSPPPSPAPPYEPSGQPDSSLIQFSPRTNYDFSYMSRLERSESNLAVVDEAQDDEAEEWMPQSWLQMLSKDYGG
jgi:hypothetical protein